ncbi:hypothetical protein [Thiomicrorhabdus indica]|uniref:hypothetical protein n=1 Tax=Thiomicrorhabdus indica TaxID=2267253 RepID=UPI00102DEA82|nr:hypothetical protein [Thiomicrorhabdus indica]
MLFLYIVLLVGSVALQAGLNGHIQENSSGTKIIEVTEEVSAYKNFTWAAKLFVEKNPAPSSKTFYQWVDIQSNTRLPSGMKSLSTAAYSNFYLSRDTNNWAVCGQLSEPAILRLEANYLTKTRLSSGSQDYIVLGETGSDADVYKTLCE